MVRPCLVGVLVFAIAALAGCGGGADRTLESSLADRLASMSETVAGRLDAGDACAARTQLVRLEDEADAAIQAGDVPDGLVDGLREALGTLDASIVCEPQTAPQPATTAEEPEDESGDGKGHDKEHEDKGKGNDKKGHDDNDEDTS
jgi:hypothetical protein